MNNNNKGFTLLEILLVIAIIAILAGIVIFAINPGRQLAQARNAQRRVDVNTILNAVYQYALDNNGSFPTIPVENNVACADHSGNEICKSGSIDGCDVDLNILMQDGKYLVSIPSDPTGSAYSGNGNGYGIQIDNNNRVTVCAPKAELSERISVTR